MVHGRLCRASRSTSRSSVNSICPPHHVCGAADTYLLATIHLIKTYMEFIDLHQDIAGAELHPVLKNQTSFEQLEFAQVKIVFGTGFALPEEDAAAVIERDFSYYEGVCARKPSWRIVLNADDLKHIVSTRDARGIVFHIEGLSASGTSSDALEAWHARGLRSIGPVWNTDNIYGGGTNSSNGLTSLGVALIEQAESLGILIDLSHANTVMCADMLGATKRPPFISHGGLSSVVDSRRNFTDDHVREVARRGGIVGIFFPKSSMARGSAFTVNDIAEHIRTAVDAIGEDAVAIGSDFGGMTSGTPRGLDSVSEIESLWKALLASGLTNGCVQKIAYGNARRYLSENLPRR